MLVPIRGESAAPGPDLDTRMDLDRAVRRLPERQRLVVTLYYVVDLTVADIAQVLGIKPGSVKSALFDARHQLRLTMGDTGDRLGRS